MTENTTTNNVQELSKKEKRAAYNKAYREANEEKSKQYQKDYQQTYQKDNKEKLKNKSKTYREANKEKENSRAKVYYENNKERIKTRQKEYYLDSKENILAKKKDIYKNNKESHKALCKKWTENNKEQVRAYTKDYREINKEKSKEYNKTYYQNNKETIKRGVWLNHKKRLLADELYAAKCKLRINVLDAFKRIGKNKPADTQTLLGCSWEEAKAHFESLFTEGMSWSNHGEWHIDHIRPVASFGPDELDQMNHISNLQPLWAKDNLVKSDTYVI